MTIGNKSFSHYIKPFTGWFYDKDGNKVNLNTKIDEVIVALNEVNEKLDEIIQNSDSKVD